MPSWNALCADGLTDAHFLGSFCRSGRREVHEIDAGDSQHDQADDHENPGIILVEFLKVDIIQSDIGAIRMNISKGKQE